MSLISEVVDIDCINSKNTTINIETRVANNAFFLFAILNPHILKELFVLKSPTLIIPSIMKAMM